MISSVSVPTLFTLLITQVLASTPASHPARGPRWVEVPRTLQNSNPLESSNHKDVDIVGFQSSDRKSLFSRQNQCYATEVACRTGCCPSGFTCYYPGTQTGCCKDGTTCTGPVSGCADPNARLCPESVGGCCPIGQLCYRDTLGVARCDSAGLFSSTTSRSVASTYTPPSSISPTNTGTTTTRTTTASPYVATPSPVSNSTLSVLPSFTVATAGPTGSANIAATGPAIGAQTTASGAERTKRMGVGALVAMLVGSVVLIGFW